MHPIIEEALVGHMERLKAANEALGAMLRWQQQQAQSADPAKEQEALQRKREIAKMTQRLVSQVQIALNALDGIQAERDALESKLTEIIDDEESRESVADPKYRQRLTVIRDVLEQVATTLPGFAEPPIEQQGESPDDAESDEIVLGSEAKG